jgi:very-short-patch-repair endonuclease
MSDFIIVAVVVAVLLLLALGLISKLAGSKPLPVVAKRLMTPREREMILLIEAAVPHCRVHAQVSMGALIETQKGLAQKERITARNRFDRKIIDFVLEEKGSGDVLALVELDDRSHNVKKDGHRDALTRAAGYKTIRIRPGRNLNPAAIREAIMEGLSQEFGLPRGGSSPSQVG